MFDGDPRALAQYLLNIAHDVREILAKLGLRSLAEARGRTDLLQLLDHPASVGELDVRAMLTRVPVRTVDDPVYLEADFALDDALLEQVTASLFEAGESSVEIDGIGLRNHHKSVGGQLSVDLERLLNHTPAAAEQLDRAPAVLTDDRGRRFLAEGSVRVTSTGTAGQSYGAFCNDGLELVHTGTANDGVAKSQSGGRIIVRTPGGGSTEPGGNVLIGNFALFGATGGRTFVQGEAGDRFAVRNSGATAVVEGVGDFCCEYMTNGAVLNLGTFGKGLGNGMSGGFVYQYDPTGELADRASDSLLVQPLVGVDVPGVPTFHEEAVLLMLQWHLESTGSALAARLLQDWEQTRTQIAVGTPTALLLYQDSDQILAAKPRKELLDELATSVATDRLRQFKLSLRDGHAIAGGRTPVFGEPTSPDAFAVLSSYTVLAIAQEIALERVPGTTGPGDPRITAAARKLVLTEDFFVRQKLLRYVRGKLERFDDAELAAQIAMKRLGDYQRSLQLRNVRGMDAPGTYGWILHQQQKNASWLDRSQFDELLVTAALDDLAQLAHVALTEEVPA